MKETKNYKFINACITEEDGKLLITESAKDGDKIYDLSARLEEFINVEGISLQLGKTSEITPDLE